MTSPGNEPRVGRPDRGPSAALLLLLAAVAGCTEPPRPARDDGRRRHAPQAEPAAADAVRFVAVPPGDARRAPPPPAEVDAGAALPDASDAGSSGGPPDMTPEEERDIRYPNHAVVIAALSPVYHRADSGSQKLGYLRKGATVRLGLMVDRGRGCVGGKWYPLEDKGFVCSTSLKIDTRPPEFVDGPRPPDRSAVLPYRYGHNNHRRAYALTRLPDAEELALVRLRRDELVREDEALAAADAAADGGTADAGAPLVELDAGEPDGEAPPPEGSRKPVVASEPEFEHVPTAESANGEPGGPAGPDAGTAADAGAAVPPDAGRPEVVYTLAGPAPGTPGNDLDSVGGLVAQWLDKDFFVSIDRTSAASGERFYRTIRGQFVPAEFVVEVEAPRYQGLIIGVDMPLPIGFVGKGRPTTYRRGAGSRALAESGRIARQAYRFLREKDKIGANEYWVTTDGEYVRAHNFGVAEETEPPADAGPDGKWILIDLSDQLLVAYQGPRPVFAALVSTGKENFETPAGAYHIVSKHVSATMDGVTELDGAYSIEDVPWTMFFNENFAVHGAFWHNRFGMTKSHGCVNMSPIDAKWIFEWSEPRVPEGWHGVFGSNLQPGTVVIIRE